MKRKQILVVDDNPAVLKAFSYLLAAEGYEVLTAPDGGTAISIARAGQPSLILLDITFPPDVAHGGGVPWDAFLIMNWLGRMEEARNIPVVLMSGGDVTALEERIRRSGAVGFYHKSAPQSELVGLLRAILEHEPIPTAP